VFLTKKANKISDIFEKRYSKLRIPLEAVTCVLSIFTAVRAFWLDWLFFGIVILVLALEVQLSHMQKHIQELPVLGHIAAAVMSASVTAIMTVTASKAEISLSKGLLYLIAIPFDLIVLYIVFSSVLGYILRRGKKKILAAVLMSSALSFILTIYLATDTFVNNFADFPFYYQQLLPTMLWDFVMLTLSLAVIILGVREKHFNIGMSIVMGLILAVYVQYMFMNNRLDMIGMQEFDWKKHAGFAVFNGAVWLFIIAVPLLMLKFNRKLWDKLSTIVPAAMLALHVITAVTMVSTSKNDLFGTHNHAYMTTDEMYTVSKHKNVIVLVYDAADNKYIDKIMKEHPEKLDDFKDFTVYTNTCSVYDFTTMSFAQMFSGVDFDNELTGSEFFEKAWKGPKAEAFYGGLHDMGYRVNAYNMNGGTALDWNGIFDNAAYSEKAVQMKPSTVHRDMLRTNLHSLEMYRALPFAAKRFVDEEKLSFENIVIFDFGYKYYENSDFLAHTKLSPADNDDNYFIIQHTKGTHYPCNIYDEMDTCFDITRSYIDQLKEMGVYDDSVIIVTSDHGEHSVGETGATPIFMIKEANTSHDRFEVNNSPMYFTDLLSTFAVNAGFDKETAEKEFGPSIYDFDEDSVRERTWYDRTEDADYPKAKIYGNQMYHSDYNTFYAYTYEGDSDTLDEMVKNGDVTEIYPIKEFIQ